MQVRASHLLVKHRDSRRPSSWKVPPPIPHPSALSPSPDNSNTCQGLLALRLLASPHAAESSR